MGMMLALCPLRAPAGDLWGSLTLLLLGPCGVGVSLILGMGCFCFGDDTVRYRGWLSNLEGPLPPQVARGLVMSLGTGWFNSLLCTFLVGDQGQ